MKSGIIKTHASLLRQGIACLALALGAACAHADDYAMREDVSAFVEEIAARNGLETAPIYAALSRASHIPRVIDLITPPAKRGVRSWQRYRNQFLGSRHIGDGLSTWAQYENELRRAEQQYGVPPEIILGILGVETIYGNNKGNFETLSALATLAFDYPPRAELFRGELESLFLLAREQGRPPSSYVGSYAGAIGWPQFLPSSIRRYAVDFSGDGKIDFDSDGVDAIGSIANYLHMHGWTAGTPVAVRVRLVPGANPAPLIEAGIEPRLSQAHLLEAGIRPLSGAFPSANAATLVDLETPGMETEYWLGYRNFYVITRYNRSSFYAMAVFQLASALRTEKTSPFNHDGIEPPAPRAKSAVTRKASASAKTKPAKAKKPRKKAATRKKTRRR
ncbi:MAG: lytic murein transglycosylase B [Azoarcus sp.]|jgi:membrane-bound lytic murein transglycosylase B|nr:lytic murein transglycosylase B [Azoarcus sp.]